MATIETKLKPFVVPNFVLPESKVLTRQEGFTPATAIPLRHMSYESLDELCNEFRASVLEKAGLIDRKHTTKGE